MDLAAPRWSDGSIRLRLAIYPTPIFVEYELGDLGEEFGGYRHVGKGVVVNVHAMVMAIFQPLELVHKHRRHPGSSLAVKCLHPSMFQSIPTI